LSRTDPFGDLAESMLGLLDALGVRRAAVVGNSLGGACALRMALERPQRISRLVLMGPGGIARAAACRRRASGACSLLRRGRPDD